MRQLWNGEPGFEATKVEFEAANMLAIEELGTNAEHWFYCVPILRIEEKPCDEAHT